MTQQQWQRVQILFFRLLPLPPERRQKWLRHSPRRDAVVLHEVIQLLDSYESAGDFPESHRPRIVIR